jgi:hypothetical protein
MKPDHSARDSPAAPIGAAVVSVVAAVALAASVIIREILPVCWITAHPS